MRFKIYLIFVLAMVIGCSAFSQQISQGEYFFNHYVDFGEGTSFSLNDQEANLDVDISSLPAGINKIYTRVKNENGLWSLTTQSTFYKYQAPQNLKMVEAEYFIDDYVDFGKGNTLALEEGSGDYLIELDGLSPGIHLLYIRAKNNLGQWSQLNKSVFYVEDGELAKIVALHYRFVGEDFTSESYVFEDFEPSTEVVLDQNDFMANSEGLEEGKTYKMLLTAVNEKGQSSFRYTISFVYSEVAQITIESIETVDLTCFEANDGNATINATLAGKDLEYSLDGENYVSNSTFENLSAGDYTAYIREANNAENVVEESFFITSPALLELTVQGLNQPNCPGDETGGFNIAVSGGTAPYEYKLSSQEKFKSENSFGNLGEGSYTVNVRDANGCDQIIEVDISPLGERPSVPTIEVLEGSTITLQSSNSGNNQWFKDGEIIPEATGQTYEVLEEGAYQVMVTNSTGCTAISESLEIGPITLENIETEALSCFESNDGSATINATVEKGELEYSLDGQNYTSENTFGDLAAGNYTGYIREVGEPAYVIEPNFTITRPAKLMAEVGSISHPNCPNEASGNFTISTTGGTAPYNYSLSGQGGNQEANSFENLQEGDYTVTVKDANGCSAAVAVNISAQGEAPAIPTIGIEGMDEISAELFLESSSAQNNQWLKDGEEIPGATGQTLDVTEAGSYQVRVTGSSGCTSISEPVAITSSPEISDLDIKLYPNPVEDVVQIEFGRETLLERIRVYNANGILIRDIENPFGPSNSFFVDLSGYTSGIYTIQVEGYGLFERLRLIKK
ncbi:T9SS type A sorting domain-containing protein [Echinicola jeungdonensis]|uniref:T9SS type A sorting domain-containing protein n=1 Tax=Echinicola jeungdonensis TaxID=709343 RepID=A0ABV5J0B4_9BACT|nr:T9SS type A sorting domain-containing protein [Echinicola jeungdonensis]MDN3671132.1 T9SS type A sorting domain-containing protein [Echinicola jeungdonensis]